MNQHHARRTNGATLVAVATWTPQPKAPPPKALIPENIRELAYQLWVGRGSPHGSPDTDWFNAERLLRAELLADEQAQEARKQLRERIKDTASGKEKLLLALRWRKSVMTNVHPDFVTPQSPRPFDLDGFTNLVWPAMLEAMPACSALAFINDPQIQTLEDMAEFLASNNL